jgi:hypothetical protein
MIIHIPIENIDANTSRYELADSILITFLVILKIKRYSGGKGVYEFRLLFDKLFLTIIEEYSMKEERE